MDVVLVANFLDFKKLFNVIKQVMVRVLLESVLFANSNDDILLVAKLFLVDPEYFVRSTNS